MSGTVRTDAERYRFLRDHCSTSGPNSKGVAFCVVFFNALGDDLNAAIDAAMEPEVPTEELAAPAAAAEPTAPCDDMRNAKYREARRIILAQLRKSALGRTNINVLADVLESYGLFLVEPERMDVCLLLESDGLVQILRTPFMPAVLLLTEKGHGFWDRGDRFK